MKLIDKIGFEQMNREQRDIVFEIMDFASDVARRTGDQRARNHANYLCKKLISLFDGKKIPSQSSNIIPFRGGDLT